MYEDEERSFKTRLVDPDPGKPLEKKRWCCLFAVSSERKSDRSRPMAENLSTRLKNSFSSESNINFAAYMNNFRSLNQLKRDSQADCMRVIPIKVEARQPIRYETTTKPYSAFRSFNDKQRSLETIAETTPNYINMGAKKTKFDLKLESILNKRHNENLESERENV